jgi:hypothetical protein
MTELEKKPYCALKTVPLFALDSRHQKRQSPIFAADFAEASEPDFEFTPREPLHWWYAAIKPRREEITEEAGPSSDAFHWKRLPPAAIVPLDQNNRVIRLVPEQLERPFNVVTRYLIGVSADGETRPERDASVSYDPGTLVPVTPVRVDGTGSSSHPPHAVEVTMSRTKVPRTKDEILWVVIRNSANSLGFNAYQDFMDGVFANSGFDRAASHERRSVVKALELPGEPFLFSGLDAYRVLRIATEIFVMSRCGVVRPPPLHPDPVEEEARFGHNLPGKFEEMWEQYLVPLGNGDGRYARILPYLDLIRRKLGDIGAVRTSFASIVDRQAGLLQEKLVHPVLLETIWSYWMEEAMLVQSFNSILRRFQNVRSNGERDPLAQLELDPLRPVNNLLWGYVQDEQSRLSVLRRAHEYDHQYGFTLHGKALAELRTADRRSKFLEAFHNLLWKCTHFYSQDDDTTVIADGFPILNALKETHYLLAQGAHNQFGNLPATARQEMLMQQWILSRPEMREFLGARVMAAYPESWMDRVDAVKTLKGWTDTSVVHFRDLAVFGEQILLSIRWGAWSTINDPNNAANWARYWRAEVQGYMHGYRAATGVDLTADITDQRQAETRYLPPSIHLRNRLAAQVSR